MATSLVLAVPSTESGWTTFYAVTSESTLKEMIGCGVIAYETPLVLDKSYALDLIKRDVRRTLGLTPSSAEPNYSGAPPPGEFPLAKLTIQDTDLLKLFLSSDVDVDKPGPGSAALTFRMRMKFPFASPGNCETFMAPSGHKVSYHVDVVTVDGAGTEVYPTHYYDRVKAALNSQKRWHRGASKDSKPKPLGPARVETIWIHTTTCPGGGGCVERCLIMKIFESKGRREIAESQGEAQGRRQGDQSAPGVRQSEAQARGSVSRLRSFHTPCRLRPLPCFPTLSCVVQ